MAPCPGFDEGAVDGARADVPALLHELGAALSELSLRFAVTSGVHPTDLRAISLIREAEKPLAMGQLAERLELTTGAVTGLVDRLERSGLVRRVRDPADRRRVHLECTERGGQVAGEYLGRLAARLGAPIADLDHAELAAVHRFLRQAIDGVRGGPPR